ncbi:unnamed protein product [Allacma fusca]|uniref:Integrase catalytic domain-containing protein n=1 Tax=Allacma fusca TaxID=39272 RepID=A0A8J2L6C3_9HEXA|nr:unnamed protein product [Allacma fusca]
MNTNSNDKIVPRTDVHLKVLPVKIAGPGGEATVNAIMDDGSTVSLIDMKLALKLGIHGRNVPLCIQWTNGDLAYEDDSEVVCFTIRGVHNGAKLYHMNGVRTTANSNLPSFTFNSEDVRRNYRHLSDVPFSPVEDKCPLVLIGRRREKRYGVLFTCLTVRAVHLEMAQDLSTPSMLNALRRFIGRRGSPENIYSDNGTNFKGAQLELREAFDQMNGQKIREAATIKGINWHFIPPASPHMGGCWERLVRSVKVALEASLHERAPREEVLQTLLVEAEALVNSRPLTFVSVDPDDPESLTPNHFLLGKNNLVSSPDVWWKG